MLEEYKQQMEKLTSETIAYEYFDLQKNHKKTELIKSKCNRLIQILKDRNELDLILN
jgi:hypothetical protein